MFGTPTSARSAAGGGATVHRVVRWTVAGLLSGLLLGATVSDVRAGCSTAICVSTGASSCAISGTNVIDNGCTLNWSGLDVTLNGTASLETAHDGDYFSVLTDDFDVLGTIKARGSIGTDITATGFFKTRIVSSSPGKIDVSNGGSVTISASGNVQIDGGTFTADGIGGSTIDGGSISITGAAVTTTKSITAAGAVGGGWGGAIEIISSSGNMSIGGDLLVDGAGASAQGGSISLDSAGTLTVTKRLHANGASDGDGGSVDMIAVGAASTSSTVKVNGGASGGGGGDVSLDAASVTISDNWSSGGGTGADGGTLVVTAENGGINVQSGGIFSDDGGSGGSGDEITLDATGGDITVSASMSSSGSGGWDGGDITFSSDRNVTVSGNITATGSGAVSNGGTIDFTAGSNHTLSVTKTLDARSTTTNGNVDGDIFLAACNVSVTTAAGNLKTRNTSVGSGRNKVTYQGTYTLGASTSSLSDDPAPTCSSTNGNIILCRCPDANNDLVCDSATCVSSPTLSGTVTPTAAVCPTVMPACG